MAHERETSVMALNSPLPLVNSYFPSELVTAEGSPSSCCRFQLKSIKTFAPSMYPSITLPTIRDSVLVCEELWFELDALPDWDGSESLEPPPPPPQEIKKAMEVMRKNFVDLKYILDYKKPV